ncbi:MAG: hypothetical protein GDA43_07150 [Hormoscilla sp. SP5CHS1]|nr:hypothetical protein [Hormoscilla sp. SP5CHS1]
MYLNESHTGVFIGIYASDYQKIQSLGERDSIDMYTNLGGAYSIAANRISYLFDFKGPSMALDTACSSSLVAVYLACQSIWNGKSAMALAGGVNALIMWRSRLQTAPSFPLKILRSEVRSPKQPLPKHICPIAVSMKFRIAR